MVLSGSFSLRWIQSVLSLTSYIEMLLLKSTFAFKGCENNYFTPLKAACGASLDGH